MSKMKYEIADCVPLAAANAELQQGMDWKMLFEQDMLEKLEQYCWAHNTELEYVLVPFFAMGSAVTGRLTKIRSGLLRQGRSNIYLLMAGNPASGKSCGFELAVNKPKAAIEKELGTSLITSDLSRPALLKRLQQQTEENQPYLIIASDEMGLYLKGECKDTKDWEVKRSIYNNSFSGSDIVSERMIGTKKINTVTIRNPHLSIIGMTQRKPLFEWIRSVSSNDDGLLDRYLIWVVAESSKAAAIPDHVQLPLDWPTQCLLSVTKYHLSKPNKEYVISSALYRKIHELECKNTQLHKQQWIECKQLVGQGKEEEAVLYNRNKVDIPVARFSELTIRFALGIHVGLFAMNQILNEFDLGNIPEDISETTVDFSIAAVQRCINQVHDFRMAAAKVSSKQIQSYQLNDDANQGKIKHDSYQLRCRKVTKPDKNLLYNISNNRKSNAKQHNEENNCSTFSQSSAKLTNADKILRRITTFPAAYFVPKAIYRSVKGANASDVLRTFHDVSQKQSSKGYLGDLVKVKITPQSKQSQMVLFRAPYDKVDTDLLKQHSINDKNSYEQLLQSTIGGDDCPLKKAIEHGGIKWEDFEAACIKIHPTFE